MVGDKISLRDILEKVLEMVKRQGWGEDGVQDPLHVAMAMSVEMGELLEHFAWIDKADVEKIRRGENPEEAEEIGEEFADVMIYGLQLMNALGLDAEEAILRKIDIVSARSYPKAE
ncbi:MAG: MazG-like family protein [Christensenellales bacterium]|jgi:dCTP diphosphatase